MSQLFGRPELQISLSRKQRLCCHRPTLLQLLSLRPEAWLRMEQVPMQFVDYIELLEWTGRCVRAKGPGGRLRGKPPQLLTTLRLRPEAWLRTMEHQGLRTVGVLGSLDQLEAHAELQGKHWVHGRGWAKQLYANPN